MSMMPDVDDMKYSKGLEGIVAAISAISYIDGLKGILVYRGYSIQSLAKHSTFEEVLYLLVYGELPTKPQLEN